VLLGVADEDVIRNQIGALADKAESLRRLELRVIPLGATVSAFSTVGFTVYDFRAPGSPAVAWIESPTGDVHFSAPDDLKRYAACSRRCRTWRSPVTVRSTISGHWRATCGDT
jgi:hypothetical protein